MNNYATQLQNIITKQFLLNFSVNLRKIRERKLCANLTIIVYTAHLELLCYVAKMLLPREIYD
ncbi:hypothetical protein C8R32_107117 [Nitrosospira sp. Nsp5]|uniref:Uncharacterized protein n=1 Tax=Nitrosospira multiformis TaxID=1231 RepID=A0ABY0TCY8_9PROT|nr:hypothetical protein C8R32_107117 [Nitrosospira sp. Nsp5]SCY11495.1 hypothetical protein SAMN05216308_104114 [Nitrosospira sp. Nsp13]SDQ41203.1 hypothetical protein SAMN05216402_0752 [Nitrosospira multiformis]